MKLTPGQLDWLRFARACGYARGFVCKRIGSLTRLERLGLIETDPGTQGPHTRWRVTHKGERVPLGQP